MENTIRYTEGRVRAADIDGLLDRNTRQLYKDFNAWKDTYHEAKRKCDDCRTLIQQGAQSIRLDLNTARRTVNIAESKLTTLSTSIAQAILTQRRNNRCIHRVNYGTARA